MHPATLEHLATLHHHDLEREAAKARLISEARSVQRKPGDESSGAHHGLHAAIAGAVAVLALIAGIVSATSV